MPPKKRRACLYLRVSTDRQTTQNQRLELERLCERRGWPIVQVYEDNGISGAKGREKRPGLDQMLNAALKGRCDVVVCWALDRLGRSLADLIGTLQELEAAHVDLVLLQQSIDTTAPAGKLFFHLLGAFAEFERSMIQQRIHAGLARARAKGVRFGRPRIGEEKDKAKRRARIVVEDQIREKLKAGTGMLKIARELGVGSGTVQRLAKEMREGAKGGPKAE